MKQGRVVVYGGDEGRLVGVGWDGWVMLIGSVNRLPFFDTKYFIVKSNG